MTARMKWKGCLCLAFVVIAGCGLFLPAKAQEHDPCPNASEITPCVCTSDDTNGRVYMDCSLVLTNDRLAAVFQVTFPTTYFYKFTIDPDTPSPDLTIIQSGVFGLVTFEEIVIVNTRIEVIEEEALTLSKDSLQRIDAVANRLHSFPFETIPLYPHLHWLNLAGNMFSFLPDIVSDSLMYLTLTDNRGLSLTVDTFREVTRLYDLKLDYMDLGYIPPQVFSQLNQIYSIDLSYNGFKGELWSGFMEVPADSLHRLYLNGNELTNIEADSIVGVDRSVIIDFRDNLITKVEKEYWVHLFDQITRNDAIDLRDNPLMCGCDLLWLVQDNDQMIKLHKDTTCSDGITLVHDLPLDEILGLC